jgi:hypothetical protein
MSAKEIVDAVLRLLEVFVSWPVIFLIVVVVLRRQLPDLISKLADRVTKAPGGFEFAVLQQKVETLGAKIEQLEKLQFEPSTALTPALQKELQSSLDAFQAYLAKLGYEPDTSHVGVFVDPALKDNVYYDGNRIVLGEPLAKDTDAAFREYTHHALLAKTNWLREGMSNEQQAVESGLADYFACSFNDDPLFGEKSIHLFRQHPDYRGKAAIRNMKNDRTFDEAAINPELHNVGEIWSGAFWEMRERLGQDVADRLLFTTWKAMASAEPHGDFGLAYAKKLLETAESSHGEQQSQLIRTIFKRRRLKLKG